MRFCQHALILSSGLLFMTACAGNAPPDVQKDAQQGARVESAASLAAETASLPDTDILFGELSMDENGALQVVNLAPLISGPGYQNQPHFAGAGLMQFYYAAEGSSGKTDIYVYDPEIEESVQLTFSPEKSEYSPKPAPMGGLSFIQESEDGEMTRVHRIGAPGDDGAAVIEFGALGYYEWLGGGETLGVFYRGEPPALYLVDVESEEKRKIFENVGRSFQASPDGGTLYVTQADDEGNHQVMSVAALSGDASPLLALPSGAQDFFLMFNGAGAPSAIFSVKGSSLLARRFDDDAAWNAVADVSLLGYGEITRVAIGGPLKLAIVANPVTE